MKQKGIIILTFVVMWIFLPSASNAQYYVSKRRYRKNAPYLDVDSVYSTPVEKKKFYELKKQFLAQWLDSSNRCMYDRDGKLLYQNIDSIYVDNILHTTKYDSVIVLFTIRQKNINLDEDYSHSYAAFAIRAIIDSLGRWNFRREQGSFLSCHCYSCGSVDMAYFVKYLRRMMLFIKVLNKKKEIDSKFFHLFFTKNLHDDSETSGLLLTITQVFVLPIYFISMSLKSTKRNETHVSTSKRENNRKSRKGKKKLLIEEKQLPVILLDYSTTCPPTTLPSSK